MQSYPFFVTALMLFLLASVQATFRFPVAIANQYAALVNPALACHEALIRFADANQAAFGTIPQAQVDAMLPPGAIDPGTFTYLITAPGTATTYLTAPVRGQGVAIATLQKLTAFSVTAGLVIAGFITPLLPAQPVAAPAGVPNGVIAIQTVLRNH